MKAAIVITVYNRNLHFSKTIDSLIKCVGANSSPLYIAIDAPKDEEARIKQSLIKEYINNIPKDSFEYIKVIERKNNLGPLKNFLDTLHEVFVKYDKIIYTEDDNIFSTYFLQYVNECLNNYELDDSIYAVCGYLEPMELNLDQDIFLRQGFTSNGFGIWKNKFNKMLSTKYTLKKEELNYIQFNSLLKSLGYHVLSGLIYSERNQYPLLDYYTCFYLYKESLFCIFPKESLVRNIGQDGSGIHSGKNLLLQNQKIYNGKITTNNARVSGLANRKIYNYHKRSVIHTIYQYTKYLGLLL